MVMQEGKIKKSDPGKKYRRVLSASTLAGDRVRNSTGENLGKVDEIMIDIPSGRVALPSWSSSASYFHPSWSDL